MSLITKRVYGAEDVLPRIATSGSLLKILCEVRQQPMALRK